MKITKRAKYYSDGFVIGNNPSKIGGGFTVTDKEGKVLVCEKIFKKGFTNNEGEILGILWCLRVAKQMDSVSTDSMVCLSWVGGGYSKARPDLNHILKECKELKMRKNINLMWEGRDFNLAGLYNDTALDRTDMYHKARDQHRIDVELAKPKEFVEEQVPLPFGSYPYEKDMQEKEWDRKGLL